MSEPKRASDIHIDIRDTGSFYLNCCQFVSLRHVSHWRPFLKDIPALPSHSRRERLQQFSTSALISHLKERQTSKELLVKDSSRKEETRARDNSTKRTLGSDGIALLACSRSLAVLSVHATARNEMQEQAFAFVSFCFASFLRPSPAPISRSFCQRRQHLLISSVFAPHTSSSSARTHI